MKVADLIPSVFPTTQEMCVALGVTKAAVSQWRKEGIPPLRQFQIREVIRERAASQPAAA